MLGMLTVFFSSCVCELSVAGLGERIEYTLLILKILQ